MQLAPIPLAEETAVSPQGGKSFAGAGYNSVGRCEAQGPCASAHARGSAMTPRSSCMQPAVHEDDDSAASVRSTALRWLVHNGCLGQLSSHPLIKLGREVNPASVSWMVLSYSLRAWVLRTKLSLTCHRIFPLPHRSPRRDAETRPAFCKRSVRIDSSFCTFALSSSSCTKWPTSPKLS